MKAIVVAGQRSEHQTTWGGAFADGLKRHGWNVSIEGQSRGADLLVLWGARRKDAVEMQRRHGEICILERGYLGDRFAWTSVSFGGNLNGRAEFRGVRSDGARFNAHFGRLLQPWRWCNPGAPRDGYALLIGQVPGDAALESAGGNLARWYEDTTRALAAAGYAVRFRPHPMALRRGYTATVPGAPPIGGTLADALNGAAVVATYNSNTAVESVLAGVPTTVADRGSMAWDVSGREPGDTLMPERWRWAAELAWKQYTLEEMASGECWANVGDLAGDMAA